MIKLKFLRNKFRFFKTITVVLIVILLLNACIVGLVRLAVPRAGFANFVRLGSSLSVRGTMMATVGRSTSLALARGLSTSSRVAPGRVSGEIIINSLKGQQLGRMVINGRQASLFIKNNRHPIVKMNRKGDVSTLRNFDGQLLGRAKYRKNDSVIEYYDPKDRLVGKDVYNHQSNKIQHLDSRGRVLRTSQIEKRGDNNLIYRAIRQADSDLIEFYIQQVGLDNEEVTAAYDKYADLVEQCLKTADREICRNRETVRSAVVSLIEYHGGR